MRYEDFILQIGPNAGQGYAVSVVKSPAGEGAGLFQPPFDTAGVERALRFLWRSAGESQIVVPASATPARGVERLEAEGETGYRPREVGDALFRGLFKGQVRSLFDQSLGKIEASGDCGLRLQLKLNPAHPDLARLYAVPWELLYRSDTQDFLSLSRLTPVVRYLDVSRPSSPYPLPQPLRVLVAMASPSDLPKLDLDRERHNIEAAWGHSKNVEVVFLPRASAGAIREELLEGTFHVLHFMGHGGFDPRTGEGALQLENDLGAAQPLSGKVLASKLKDFRSLRLVFLNACETARSAVLPGYNPFSGVASALVLGGIPAVVAMQFPITDDAALAFSRSFYQRLAAGDPVDSAVAEGRQAVHSKNAESVEWATPVLFLRTPDGLLFGRPGSPIPPATQDIPRPVGLQRVETGKPSLLAAGQVSTPALTPPPSIKGGSGLKVGLGLLGVSALVGLGAWLGRQSSSSVQAEPEPTTLSSRSVPPGTAGPAALSSLELRPDATFTVDQPFESQIPGFTGWISKVEMRGDRMRWQFHFLNRTDHPIESHLVFRGPTFTYLADETGKQLVVLALPGISEPPDSFWWGLPVGVRRDLWLEFERPRGGPQSYTVVLATPDNKAIPRFKPFRARLQ
jgi:hypothetical protein